MKKKIILTVISILILSTGILVFNKNEVKKDDVLYLNENDIKEKNSGLGVYIKNDLGTYTYSKSVPNKESGYVFNPYESVCEGKTEISWDNNKWGAVLSNIEKKQVNCYLYFLKDDKPSNDFTFFIGGPENPEYTNTTSTKVYLSWQDDDIKDYCILTEDNVSNCEWKSVVKENSIMLVDLDYSLKEDYELSGPDGTKTLYAYLRDKYNQETAVKSDDIKLDQTKGGFSKVEIDEGNGYTQNAEVSVRLEWNDDDIAEYCITETNDSSTCTWTSYTDGSKVATVSHTFTDTNDGTKTIYAFIKDKAGNISEAKSNSDDIIKDTVAPTPTTFTITGRQDPGADSLTQGYTHMINVTYDLGWGDDDVLEYCISTSSSECLNDVWEGTTGNSTTASKPSLDNSSGEKIMYLILKDKAGNITSIEHIKRASIIVDLSDPVVTDVSQIVQNQTDMTLRVTANDTDSSGLKQYCYRQGDNGEFTCIETSELSKDISIENLEAGTEYTFYIYVSDNSGRISDKTKTYTFSTKALLGGKYVESKKPTELSDHIVGEMYRFQGKDINNYICINGTGSTCNTSDSDMYRIIGIDEDGNMKVVANNDIGFSRWHKTSLANTLWSQSNLYDYLNSTVYTGLDTKVKFKILKTKWKSLTSNNVDMAGNLLYDQENGTNNVNSDENYIGLIQVSDYYLAQSDTADCFRSFACDNWLTPVTHNYWTITRYGSNGQYYYAWELYTDGRTSGKRLEENSYVRPSFWLSSDVTLTGSGKSDDPFIFIPDESSEVS